MQVGGSCILLDRPVRDGEPLSSHYAYFVLRRVAVTQQCKLYCVTTGPDLLTILGLKAKEKTKKGIKYVTPRREGAGYVTPK